MKPAVILHTGMSLDGRIDWTLAQDSPYYMLVRRLGADCDLSGSTTILQAQFPEQPQQAYPELYAEYAAKSDRDKAILAVVDSRGQVQNWAAIKRQPIWRGFIVLCSRSTPANHMDYLEREGVPVIIAGEERVDLPKALEQLAERFGVRSVRVDSGGILNGALLRAGLVDEVSVVLNPELVGGESPRTVFTAPDLTSAVGVIRLKLEHLERLEGDYVWLRYRVSAAGGA
jgi:2,5-diamino-6-(ribosylamino)-4(3H)-pyrimidinone 5'-phosphate reductase